MAEHDAITDENQMVEHRIGRFAFQLPASLQIQNKSFELRFSEVAEVDWGGTDVPESARAANWEERMAELRKLKPPAEMNEVIIEERQLPAPTGWFGAVRYYGFDYTDERIMWEGLFALDSSGLWIRKDGWTEFQEEVVQDLVEIADAYRPHPDGHSSGFHLMGGVITLPYLEQESAYVRFEGHPLQLELEIKMNSTDDVSELSLLERLTAAVASDYAPGINVEELRTGTRELAGIKGEEAVLRLSENGETDLSFSWMYVGQEDSGEFPKILMKMRSPDNHVDEKMAVWDRILESMRPLSP